MKFMKFSQKFIDGVFLIFWLERSYQDQLCFEGFDSVFVYEKSMHGTLLFFSFTTNWFIEFLLIFCMKWQQQQGWKLGKIILIKFLFWDFWGKKAPKWAQNLIWNWSMICFWFFEWSYSSIKAWNCLKQLLLLLFCFFFQAKSILISCDWKLFFLVVNSLNYISK